MKKKSNQKKGRPAFPEVMKLKAFNLPVELIEAIQKAADIDQDAGKGRGNASHWARRVFEKEMKRRNKRKR